MTHRVFLVDAKETPIRLEVELPIHTSIDFQLSEETYRESRCILGNFLYHLFHMLSFFSTPQARVSTLVISTPPSSPSSENGDCVSNSAGEARDSVQQAIGSTSSNGDPVSTQPNLSGRHTQGDSRDLSAYIVSQEVSRKALRDTMFLFTVLDSGVSFLAQAENLLSLETAAAMAVEILRRGAHYTVQDAVKERFSKAVQLFLQVLDPMLTANNDESAVKLLGSAFYKRVTEPIDIIGQRYLSRIKDAYNSPEASEAYAELLCAMLLQMCYEMSVDEEHMSIDEYDGYLRSTGYAAPLPLIQPRKFRGALEILRKAMRKLSDSSYVPYFRQSRVSPLTEISTAQELMRAVLSAFYHEAACNSALRVPEVSYHRVHLEMFKYE